MLAGAHQDHRNRRVGLGQRRGLHAHVQGEGLQAIAVLPIAEGGALAAQVRGHFLARQPHHTLDGRQWQRVVLIARAHHQRVAHRQRQGQADGEMRTLAGRALHVQRAAELADLGGHHVHADAATGLLRERTGGRKSGLEHQLHHVIVREQLVGADQPQRQSLAADRRQVQASAVVAHLDDHFGALAQQAQLDVPGFGFAAAAPFGGRFNAMHDGVAQQVLEGWQHALEHLAIQFAGGAFDHELGLL